MSYILDALKKAAEQRSGPPPEVRRLLSPAPVGAGWPSRSVTLGVAAAGVVALTIVVWMWAPAHDDPAPPIASVVTVPPTRDRPAAVRETPLAAGDTPPAATQAEALRGALNARRARPAAIEAAKDAPPTTAAEPRGAATKPRLTDMTPPRTAPPAAVSPAPAPPVVAALPPASQAAPLRTEVAKLKVEVIVYSDQRPLRWAFINGRKYVEGDAIGEGARVEEIQSGAVVLVEDGRRITLRP